jgi:cob(I)alamin adenosyltransferase
VPLLIGKGTMLLGRTAPLRRRPRVRSRPPRGNVSSPDSAGRAASTASVLLRGRRQCNQKESDEKSKQAFHVHLLSALKISVWNVFALREGSPDAWPLSSTCECFHRLPFRGVGKTCVFVQTTVSNIAQPDRRNIAMKLDKIYTRTGDDGKTSLGDGTRRPKFDLRVAAYGSIDEANSAIGVANLHVNDAEVLKILKHIQNDLFDVGADLCCPQKANPASPSSSQPAASEAPALRVTEEQVTWLENQIDRFNAELAPLDSFVLPGGSPAAAYLHHARTVTRRAEREVVRLSADAPVNSAVLHYVNRLSDLLFVLARFLNGKGKEDICWQPGLHR